MDTIFSHRPLAGVSVGACNVGDVLVVAFALVNDGTSRNNFYHADREDHFCRATARAIINGRLGAAVDGNAGSLTFSFETSLGSRDFMKAFRESFKPTVDESDEFLSEVGEFAGIEVRTRPLATDMVDRLTQTVHGVIANASTSV